MNFKIYKYVYWNDRQKKLRRTPHRKFDEGWEYLGTMTEVEYDLLVEVLFEVYGNEDPSDDGVQKVFYDISNFCLHLKNILPL